MAQGQLTHHFDKILIIDFLRAIQEDNPKIIGVSKEDFDELVNEYMAEDKKESPLEKRARYYYDKIFIVKATLFVLTIDIADEKMMQVLRDQGYKVERDTYFQDISNIAEALEFEEMKYDEIKNALPKKPKKKSKESEKINTFDILTSVATGLELSLNFNGMVVNEFLSYRSQLQRKITRMEKSSKELKLKKQTNGRR
jgi:hypothetical protein